MKRIMTVVAAAAATLVAWNLQADEAIAYVVVETDDIQTIAGTYEVTVEDIMITNGLETEEIEIGTVIYIPPKHARGYFDPDDRTYLIAPGDYLSAIADRFGTTVDAIKAANGMTGDEIEAGSVLNIWD